MDQIEVDTFSNSENIAAVTIRNAYKSYTSSNLVLNDLNMTVPDGVIYGLLGPSGCGKTTLLNCIVGQMTLDSGRVKLNVRRRADIGYMPQALSIHCQMTIFENFFFYGYLFGIDEEFMKSRATDLILFLQLPSGNRIVNDLSGGQQRRVSLAISIFHEPKLIILDEPTVGMDPLLSQSIWEHLVKMAESGKTIIITTHYIQEAQKAHVIGLIRNGKLLAEESPHNLMQRCNTDDLEKAFLKLSQEQESQLIKQNNSAESTNLKLVSPSQVRFAEDEKIFSKKKLVGLLYKNRTMVKRQFIFLALVLALPFFMSTFFCMSAGRKLHDLNVAVINEETSLKDCKHNIKGCFLNENENTSLSCMYLSYFPKGTYNLIEYINPTEAAIDYRKNKVHVVLHFRQNYTRALAERVLEGRYVDDSSIKNSNIFILLDKTLFITSNLIYYDLSRQLSSLLTQAMRICEQNPRLAKLPVLFQEPVFGSEDQEFITYTASAILVIICFFLPAMSSALSVYEEKKSGVLERIFTTGASINELIGAILFIQIFIFMVQYCIVIVVLFYLYQLPHAGNFFTLTALMTLNGISGMLFGVALALIGKNLIIIGVTGSAINLTLLSVTGLISSVEASYDIFKKIRWAFPLFLTTKSVRGITIRNFPITHFTVWPGFIGTTAWCFLLLLIVCVFLKYNKNALR